MEQSIKKLVKQLKIKTPDETLLYSSYAIFGLVALYILYCGQLATVGLGIGVALILYTITDCNVVVSLIGGALVGLIALHYSRQKKEGFANEEEEEEIMETPAPGSAKPKKTAPPPDNRDRAEFFDLGKPYKMPKEEDDTDIHLDAGTTFMNAYKSLKPDQISAMTKDTQELMQTQKQLMSTLSTLKPLIQDGKQMMDMFQSYFGNSGSNASLE
jgi:hypothetical protein